MESVASSRSEEEAQISEGLNKLKHLAHRMKENPSDFGEQDSMFVQELVFHLQSLHEECVKLRETFETETINASALRYHLYYLPTQIQREIKASVRAARESNTSRIQSLEDTLTQIEQNMTEMKDRLQSVDKENIQLHPQRDKFQERHEEVVTHLNQTMQEKASKQILLNDTRDQLREAHQTIADIEDDIKQLEEMLAQERADTKKLKRELKKEVDETKRKIKEQENENTVEKNQLDELRKELESKKERLQIKTRSTTMIEKNCEELKVKEDSMERFLERVRTENEKIREEIVEINKRDFEQQMEYTEVKEKLELQLKEIQENSQSVIEENTRLKKTNAKLHADLKASNDDKKSDYESIRSLKDQLGDQQREISELTDETGKLTADNDQLESEIQTIQDTHDSTMKVKNSECDSLKDKLIDVQNLRKQLQNELDDILRQMDKLKAENARQLSLINKRIVEGKKEHAVLTKEGQDLQRSIKQAETDIKSNQETLKRAKEEYQKMKEKLEKDVKMYEASIEKYTKSRDGRAEKLKHDTPIFIKLQEDHKKFGDTYNERKKTITGLKAKNSALQNEVFVAKQLLQQLDIPKLQAEEGIKRTRQETLEDLVKEGKEKKRLETGIAETGEKIVCVVDQNSRLKGHCSALQSTVEQVTDDVIEAGGHIRRLHNTCIDKRDGILAGWLENLRVTLSVNERDGVILSDLSEEERATLEKKERLELIAEDLQTQIGQMSQFLSAVTKFRGAKEEIKAEELPVESQELVVSFVPDIQTASEVFRVQERTQSRSSDSVSNPSPPKSHIGSRGSERTEDFLNLEETEPNTEGGSRESVESSTVDDLDSSEFCRAIIEELVIDVRAVLSDDF